MNYDITFYLMVTYF